MVKIDRFEDLECWKKTRELTKLIYNFTKKSEYSKDFGLKDQIRRASVSVMSNIAEGFGSKSDKEFVRYLRYAISSVNEMKSQLYVAFDQSYIEKEEFEAAYKLGEDCCGLCSGLLKYILSK